MSTEANIWNNSITVEINEKFENAILPALKEIQKGDTLIAAVSGGADSTAMLYALARLQEKLSYTLLCIHVQHNLRKEESLADEHAVVEMCSKFAIPCRVAVIPRGKIKHNAKKKGCGIEAAARDLRHDILKKEALRSGASKIAIAHNRDDLLENIIMRILRGSGPAGLALMPERNGMIIRPLLSFRRDEILSYLKSNNIPYCIDSSNSSDIYLRNRIRNHLIPLLCNFFPGWEKNLERMAETQRLVANYLKRKVLKYKKRMVKATNGSIIIDNFFSLSRILREDLLFEAINDMPDGQNDFQADVINEKKRTLKRSVIRKFAKNGLKSACLGAVEIHAKEGAASIHTKKNRFMEEGFSLVIQNEGRYRLQNMIIDCKKTSEDTFTFVIHNAR